MPLPPDALVSLSSAVALAVLGGLLLLLPRRGESLLFGCFTLLWAVQVGAANAGRLTGDATVHARALLLSFATMPPAYLLLAHLWAPRPRAWPAWTPAALAGSVACAATLVLALAPRLVVERVTGGPTGIAATTLGPAALPLFLAPFYLAFVAATAGTYLRWARSAAGAPAQRARLLFVALALFTSYLATRNLVLALRTPLDIMFPTGMAALAAPYAVGALVLAAVAAHAASRRRDDGSAATALWALALPAGTAVLETWWAPSGVLGTGAWRLACVGVVAYALGRSQLFDLEARMRDAAGPALAALLAGLGVVGAAGAAASGAGSREMALPLVAGLAASGAALAGRRRLGRVLVPRTPDERAMRLRKLEVYRVRLEESVLHPSSSDERDLAALRARLGVTEQDHELMQHLLRQHHADARPGTAAPVEARYRFLRVLGEGGFGRAYLARDVVTGDDVVVKVVFGAGDGADALREAAMARAVASPHVVRVLDVVHGRGQGYVVMEHAEGGSLADLLARRGTLPLHEATRVLRQLLRGLADAHARGIVHGDVKPENVLLARDGRVMLSDFGSARWGREGATLAPRSAGTLAYMSPEQVRGAPPDARSDLYAAAAVFHRCLAGRSHLGPAADDFTLRRRIMEAPPEVPRDAPAWATALLRRALAKDPRDRPRGALDMLALLDKEAPTLAPE